MLPDASSSLSHLSPPTYLSPRSRMETSIDGLVAPTTVRNQPDCEDSGPGLLLVLSRVHLSSPEHAEGDVVEVADRTGPFTDDDYAAWTERHFKDLLRVDGISLCARYKISDAFTALQANGIDDRCAINSKKWDLVNVIAVSIFSLRCQHQLLLHCLYSKYAKADYSLEMRQLDDLSVLQTNAYADLPRFWDLKREYGSIFDVVDAEFNVAQLIHVFEPAANGKADKSLKEKPKPKPG